MNPFWERAKEAIKNRKPIKEVEDKLPKLPTVHKEEKFEEEKAITYDFRNVGGHIEVFANGEFQYSADTMKEAHEMLLSEDL